MKSMMGKFRVINVGIAGRIVYTILLSVMLMLGLTVAMTYYARLAEADAELAERGHVIVNALAASSEYGVISGNIGDLKQITQSLVEADDSISQVDILTKQRNILLRVISKKTRFTEQSVFEASILKNNLAIDSFSQSETPQVADLVTLSPQPATKQIVGYVVVKMSPSTLAAKQTNRFYITAAMMLFAALTSIPLAFLLSRNLIRQLTTAIAALRAIRYGNYDTRVPITAGGEIGDLQLSINEMAASLAESKRDLEDKVTLRTQQLEVSRNEALKADAEKRRLIQKMNSIVEDERKNIAAEIHDELNATLVVTKLNAQIILGLTKKCEPSAEIQEITEKAQTIVQHVDSLYTSARMLVRRLRPEVLDTLGLHDAIEEVVRNFEDLHSGCQFEFKSNTDQITLDSDLEITIYRLIQEALSNSIKHASATKTEVELMLNDVQGFIRITIADNGIGFSPANVGGGMGIVGMKERVHTFNGEIRFVSQKEQGTKIIITFPIHHTDLTL